jgi:hypothetical protein
MPYYITVSSILAFLSLYYYWQLTRRLIKGINSENAAVFNSSFESLYRYSLYGLMTSSFSLLFHFFDFYLTLRRHVY